MNRVKINLKLFISVIFVTVVLSIYGCDNKKDIENNESKNKKEKKNDHEHKEGDGHDH
jgi:hypothetical protein